AVSVRDRDLEPDRAVWSLSRLPARTPGRDASRGRRQRTVAAARLAGPPVPPAVQVRLAELAPVSDRLSVRARIRDGERDQPVRLVGAVIEPCLTLVDPDFPRAVHRRHDTG